MKQVLAIILICLVGITPSQAQLLKKIKEKTQKALEPKANTETPPAPPDKETNASPDTKTKWVPTSDCEKVFTLDKGEKFFYDETKVITKEGKLSYSFILQNNKYEYFLIEDGKRSGPFKEVPVKESQIVSDKIETDGGGNDDDEKIELGSGKKDAVTAQYSKTINNKLYIVFNGKNFGPYDFVAKMRVSADKKKFWATVTIGGLNDMMTKMGMGNTFLVNEAGVKQKGGDQNSIPARMMVSNNFNAAALSLMSNNGQKAVTISSMGKTQEGNVMDMFSDNKSSLTIADNGDIISIPSQSPTQLLVNGTEAAVFKVPVTNLHRLFIMPDYKKSVLYQSGKLYRGDGSVEDLTGITFPKFVMINNKPVVYYYKIHQTDTGDKDVYLCKKDL